MSAAPLTETEEQKPDATDEAAFFDLDRTIIAKDAMAAFGGPMRRRGILRGRSLVQLVLAQLIYLLLGSTERRLERIRTAALRLTKGWARDDVVAVINDAVDTVLDPIIYAEAMDLIEAHRSAGRRVVIVSASPSELVRPLALHLGVVDTIASEAAIDEDGRYTGEIAFFASGREKVGAVRAFAAQEGLDLSRSFAYSDAFTDVPMLEIVGHPVAVNPDRALAKVAAERGWEVRTFTRPVRLRDRVRDRVRAVPPRPAIAIGSGTVLLGVVAAALGFWLRSKRRNRDDEPPLRVV